ncbi:ketoacyl-ACP synthase III [bacterium]|nr:ketoacyl-ACP synthase III [bacterium]HPF34808.1 ketoacyl-ACP synthase III [Candidatus Krumholzibacteria bacterium]
MTRNARIAATGMAVPDRVVPNAWFNERLGEDVDTWLTENLTIRERRWCAPDESTADLVERAASDILDRAEMDPAEVDLLIVATDTPEFVSPSTASVVQDRLGLTAAGTFDLNTACAGFVTALDAGAKYIRADHRYENVLVLGGYAMSKHLDLDDKKTVTLFADGAAGVLLRADDSGEGWQAARLHTEGQYHGWMGIYGGGARQPVDAAALAAGDHKLRFVKKFPKEINPETWSRMIRETCGDAGWAVEDVTRFFFTQININSIRETLDVLGLGMERTHCVMDRYGYTGSACIPMALAESDAAGDLRPGDKVVFMGSGGGLMFACAAFTW